MDKLPTEILKEIFYSLGVDDIFTILSLNKFFYHLSNDCSLWKIVIEKEYKIKNCQNPTKEQFCFYGVIRLLSQERLEDIKKTKNAAAVWKTLTFVPQCFVHFRGLKTLNLENNEISSLPNNFNLLNCLENLILGHNNFTVIPEVPKSVKFLDLKYNKIRKLSNIPPNLRKLSLYNNAINTICDDVRLATNLEELCIHFNQIEVITSSFCYMTKLKYLDLGGNSLKALPEEFIYLQNLEKLRISPNFQNIPTVINSLPKLRVLNMSNCTVKEIPNFIRQHPSLEVLNLDRNCVEVIPEDFSHLKALFVAFNPIKNKIYGRNFQIYYYEDDFTF